MKTERQMGTGHIRKHMQIVKKYTEEKRPKRAQKAQTREKGIVETRKKDGKNRDWGRYVDGRNEKVKESKIELKHTPPVCMPRHVRHYT